MIRRMSLVVAAVLLLGGCEAVQEQLIRRGAERTFLPDRFELADDGVLHVVLCGTGSPLPDPARAAACTAVIAAGRMFLVDVGPGSWENVQRWRLPRERLAAVLLTHFHSDHLGDLGETTTQSWIGGRPQPLEVIGPPGVEAVVEGFARAYSADAGYRTVHHGADVLPPEGGRTVAKSAPVPPGQKDVVVFDGDGLRITAFPVDHAPVEAAYGYRFDYKGRSVVISGDTKPTASIVEHARGTDVLVHEALAAHIIRIGTEVAREKGNARLAKMSTDIIDYHTTPAQAAEEARQAGVRMLVYTHLVPGALPPVIGRAAFMSEVETGGELEIVMGEDGMLINLPAESTEIEIVDVLD